MRHPAVEEVGGRVSMSGRMPSQVRLDGLGPGRLWLVRHVFGVGYACIVVGILSLVVAGVAWHRGAAELAGAALATVGSAGAAASLAISLARKWRARGEDELRRRVGDRDPGDSPVPWISTETWRRGQAWDPAHELLHGPPESQPCVEGPEVVPVGPDDREVAPVVRLTVRAPVPVTGTVGEQTAALRVAPLAGGWRVRSPSWPSCCDRLTVLVGHEGVDAAFKDAVPRAHFLLAEIQRSWGVESEAKERELAARPYAKRALGAGHALFHCRACGRVYLGSFRP